MFFALVYGLSGLYLLLVSFGLFHREFALKAGSHRRIGIAVMAIGLLVLAFYYGYHAYFFSTARGKTLIKLEQKIQTDPSGNRGKHF